MQESIKLPSWLDGSTIEIQGSEPVGRESVDLTAMPSEIEEQLIVKDVLYCLVGAEGNYIAPDQHGHYTIQSIVRQSISSFVEQILPICNDYLIVQNFSDGHFAFEYGRIIHALCAVLKSVTSQYLQLISKLEAYRRLTLPLLIANLQSSAELIHIMASIIIQIGNKRGCQILTILHSTLSSFRGSKQVRQLLEYLYTQTSVPLLNFVEKWIYQGEIDDPFEEFFIRIDESICRENYDNVYESIYWKERFEIVKDNLPDFVSQNAIQFILSAGKAVAVLSECGLRMNKSQKITLDALNGEKVLRDASFDASFRLAKTIREKYEIESILHLFHSVYLFGRGDWIINFFSMASTLMENSCDHVHIPALDAVLKQVLPSYCTDFFCADLEENNIHDHVAQIRATSPTNPYGNLPNSVDQSSTSSKSSKSSSKRSTSDAWDYFSLKARVQWPLSLVFNSIQQSKYQIIFRTMLMWNRLKSKLQPVWFFKREKDVPRELYAAQFSMYTFVSSFINYLCF